MMKKIKYFTVMAAALLLGFSSCSNDDVTEGNEVTGTETAYIKIGLIQPKSYAVPSQTATPAESKVNGGNLYIFNLGVLEHIVPIAGFAGTTSAQEVLQTTVGVKTFYFVGNSLAGVTPSLTAVEGTTLLSTFEKTVATLVTPNMEDITRQSAAPTGDFMTTNIEKYTANIIAGGTIADPIVVTVPVGRAMAKANVEYDEAATTQPANGKLTDVKYMIRQNPKSMYFVPNFVGTQLITPEYVANPANPVSANYFDNGTVPSSGTPGVPSPTAIDGLIETQNNAGTIAANKDSYMTENANQTPKYGNSTYALLQGVFTPDGTLVRNASGNAGSYTAGNDFYRIEWVTTTGVHVEYDPNFYTGEPSTYAASLTPPAGAVSNRIRQYLGGKCYYFLYFKDVNKSSVTEKYAVARNTYFYANVTSVGDCGSNVPDLSDPKAPLEEDTYLGVKIEVKPWKVVEQTTGI